RDPRRSASQREPEDGQGGQGLQRRRHARGERLHVPLRRLALIPAARRRASSKARRKRPPASGCVFRGARPFASNAFSISRSRARRGCAAPVTIAASAFPGGRGMRYVLALDQGTSSSRAIVFDAHGTIRSSAQREFRQIFPQPGWVEHDPYEIRDSQFATAREAIASAAIDPADVAAVGIANQRETTIVWER